MSPKFSIIVPAYNVEAYIDPCLMSVRNQTFEDWECIVVDDGSTDGTAARIESSIGNDSRFVFVRQKNGGEGAARNAAMDRASGEWLILLDADDVLSPFALKSVWTCAERNIRVDIIRFGVTTFDDGTDPNFGTPCDSMTILQPYKEIRVEDVRSAVWQHAYRMQVHGESSFTGFYMGADRVFLNQCLCRCQGLGVVDTIGYGYRNRQGSVSRLTKSEKHIIHSIGYLEPILEAYAKSDKKISRLACREFGNIWTEWSVYHMFRLPKERQCVVWEQWQESLPRAFRYARYFTWWRNFVFKACRMFPWRWVAWLLCAVPQQLKLRGLHR